MVRSACSRIRLRTEPSDRCASPTERPFRPIAGARGDLFHERRRIGEPLLLLFAHRESDGVRAPSSRDLTLADACLCTACTRSSHGALLLLVPCGRVVDRYSGARIWAEASARAQEGLLAGSIGCRHGRCPAAGEMQGPGRSRCRSRFGCRRHLHRASDPAQGSAGACRARAVSAAT